MISCRKSARDSVSWIYGPCGRGLEGKPVIVKLATWKICALLAVVVGVLQIAPFIGMSAERLSDYEFPADFCMLEPHHSACDYAKAVEFNKPLLRSSLIRELAAVLVLLAVVLSGVFERVEARCGKTRWRWAVRLGALCGLSLLLYVMSFPFRVCNYFHFLAYDLSDISFKGWLRLLALEYPVGLCAFVLKYALIFCMVRIFRGKWWIATAVFLLVVFSIVPEFLKVRPVHPGWELKELRPGDHLSAMAAVAERAGVELDFMCELRSERERTANMLFCGHAANKYVVVTDTFLAAFTPAETAVALAHELGHMHWHMKFLLIYKLYGAGLLLGGLLLARAFVCVPDKAGPVDFGLLPVLVLTFALVSRVFAPVGNAISRWDERLADRYALESTQDADSFVSLLAKGATLNFEPVIVPWWYYHLFQGHPTVLERVVHARTEVLKSNASEPSPVALP